jgi:hypothetical protein
MSETEKLIIKEIPCVAHTSAGDETVKVTVGEVFTLACQSDSLNLNPSQAQIFLETEGPKDKKISDPYSLKLLKADIDPQGKWILQVVSYKVGEYKQVPFQLSDGVNTLVIKDVQFQVESVVDPKNPPKGPLGPFGPLLTEFPWGALGVLLIFVFALFLAIIFKGIRVVKIKRLKERMKQYDSPQTPVPQFYAEMRKLQREIDFAHQGQISGASAIPYLKKFEYALKLYLVRQFEVPAFEFKISLILNEFRKRYTWFGEDMHNQLGVLLRELEKAQNHESAVTTQDVHQLFKNLKRWVDRTSYLTEKFAAKERDL